MKKRKRKSTKPNIDTATLIISGLVDLIIGVLLLLIEKSLE